MAGGYRLLSQQVSERGVFWEFKEMVTLCHMLCLGDSSSMTAWSRTNTDSKWMSRGRIFTRQAVVEIRVIQRGLRVMMG